MARLSEPGSQAIRIQLDIAAEDPAIFKPNSLEESLKVARIIRDDKELDPRMRRLVEVGIVFDLMPGHLKPRRDRLARAIGCSVRWVLRREIEWEGVDPLERFVLIHRASRLIVALRAANRSNGRSVARADRRRSRK